MSDNKWFIVRINVPEQKDGDKVVAAASWIPAMTCYRIDLSFMGAAIFTTPYFAKEFADAHKFSDKHITADVAQLGTELGLHDMLEAYLRALGSKTAALDHLGVQLDPANPFDKKAAEYNSMREFLCSHCGDIRPKESEQILRAMRPGWSGVATVVGGKLKPGGYMAVCRCGLAEDAEPKVEDFWREFWRQYPDGDAHLTAPHDDMDSAIITAVRWMNERVKKMEPR